MSVPTSDDLWISVPYYQDLRKPGGWSALPDRDFAWLHFRGHFFLRYMGADRKLRMGPQLGVYDAPIGVTTAETTTVSKTLQVMQEQETLKETLHEEQAVNEYMATLASEVKTPAGEILPSLKLGADVKSRASQTLVTSMRQSDGTRTGYSITGELTRQRTLEYRGGAGRFYAVAFYQKRTYDLSLEFIDYLGITYSRHPLGIKYKRSKQPSHEQWRRNGRHWKQTGPNLLWVKRSLASVTLWRPMMDSFPTLVEESRYQCEVDRPNDPIFEPPDPVAAGGFRRTETCPSLYELSESAWPSKARRSFFEELGLV